MYVKGILEKQVAGRILISMKLHLSRPSVSQTTKNSLKNILQETKPEEEIKSKDKV